MGVVGIVHFSWRRENNMVNNNENQEICAACGGKCCNNLPGCAHPSDFGFQNMKDNEILNKLERMFHSGLWQIDWWESYEEEFETDARGLFVRPSTKVGRGSIYHGAWIMEGCVFHIPYGCFLPFEERPRDCKTLIPDRENCRHQELDDERHPKLIAIEKWIPYEGLLVQAARNVGDQEDNNALVF
jgi:hypothetical protein